MSSAFEQHDAVSAVKPTATSIPQHRKERRNSAPTSWVFRRRSSSASPNESRSASPAEPLRSVSSSQSQPLGSLAEWEQKILPQEVDVIGVSMCRDPECAKKNGGRPTMVPEDKQKMNGIGLDEGDSLWLRCARKVCGWRKRA